MKPTVPVDEELARLIHISKPSAGDEEMTSHDRWVKVTAGWAWLISHMAKSSQFTPEQREAFQQLLAASNTYLGMRNLGGTSFETEEED